jgi:type IV pilus assembly protein PilV
MNRPAARRRAWVSLIDALIAIAILSFGLIGMTRMQGRMVTSATDAQLRTTAVQLADELLNTVLVDTANAACYTLPQAGVCNSPAATARTTDWDEPRRRRAARHGDPHRRPWTPPPAA